MGESIDRVIHNYVEPHRKARSSSSVSNGDQWSSHQKPNITFLRPESECENDDEDYALPTVSEDVAEDALDSPPLNRSAQSSGVDSGAKLGEGLMDFFGADVFQMVLHNPTTAHRFLRFCQSRARGGDMEFLEKVGRVSHTAHLFSTLLQTRGFFLFCCF